MVQFLAKGLRGRKHGLRLPEKDFSPIRRCIKHIMSKLGQKDALHVYIHTCNASFCPIKQQFQVQR